MEQDEGGWVPPGNVSDKSDGGVRRTGKVGGWRMSKSSRTELYREKSPWKGPKGLISSPKYCVRVTSFERDTS